jgi:hypothetical protein
MAIRDGKPSSLKDKMAAALRLAAVGCALVSVAPQNATAATAGVPFVGTVTTNNQCTIILVNNGLFGFSADRMQMSSKLTGGAAGRAEVRSNHAYTVTAEALPIFTVAPAGGNTNVSFAARFSGTSIFNGRIFAEQPGSTGVVMRNGLSRTMLNIHLAATRTGSPFPTGNYTGVVVVRCE